MPKKWTHTSAFKHFGAVPKNVQWSWSARSADNDKVVVTLWQDQFSKADEVIVYSRPARSIDAPDNRPGHRELMHNLEFSNTNLSGVLHVIIAVAKDVTVDPRSIQHCFPSGILMKIRELDVATGYFLAHQIGAGE